jgi:hypothetical protein
MLRLWSSLPVRILPPLRRTRIGMLPDTSAPSLRIEEDNEISSSLVAVTDATAVAEILVSQAKMNKV